MARYVYNYNPTEIAFSMWVRNFPESDHPLDEMRFYVFVKTCCRYKEDRLKWMRAGYFAKRCKKAGLVDDEKIESKKRFLEMYVQMLLLDVHPIPRTDFYFEGSGSDYAACYADGESKLHFVDISEEEYDRRPPSLKTLKSYSEKR